MPGDDASVELQDLGLQCPQLTAKSSKTSAGHFRQPVLGPIGDDLQQLLDTPASDRGDNPELGKIGTDRVDDGGLLADEEVARRCSIRQLCCSTVLVGTNRMLGRLTASQIASASVLSFFCRLTYGFT